MFIDWKETPKRDEEEKFEDLKEKVLQMKTEKKIQEVVEEKTTVHQGADADRAEQRFVTTTMKGEPGKISSNFSRKQFQFQFQTEAAKVSGQETNQDIFTKPQRDYRSVGIRNRIDSDCTGNPTNGRGVCDEMGPPGQ